MAKLKIKDDEIIECLRRTLVRHYGNQWDDGAVSVADVKERVDRDITKTTLSRRLKALADQGKIAAGAPGYYMWPTAAKGR